ncbi:MAG TPA: E3 binding domain-containing protein, partial [Bacteroidales bacterium]|nr:E3 binding domain-containing protein [Bacteroidales bacterium]
MAKIEILLPAMGEGIIEATITKWLVKEGEQVDEDQSIVEIATDKVDSEIPSPKSGKIEKLLFNENDIPKVGDTIAILNTGGSSEEKTEPEKTQEEKPQINKVEEPVQLQEIKVNETNHSESEISVHTANGKFLSPLVRSIAQKENISLSELDNIRGTGNTGRITKQDILNYLNTRTQTGLSANIHEQKAESPVVNIPPKQTISNEQIYSGGDYEIVQMDRMRKLIADHMVMSKQVSPHVTSFIEVDVTNLVNWRNKHKNT